MPAITCENIDDSVRQKKNILNQDSKLTINTNDLSPNNMNSKHGDTSGKVKTEMEEIQLHEWEQQLEIKKTGVSV